MSIKIVIGCFTHLVAEGMRKLLENDEEIEVIEICHEVIDFKKAIEKKPDIVIVGFSFLNTFFKNIIFTPPIKAILLGDKTLLSTSDRRLTELILRGVRGILSPLTDSFLLKKAIKTVSSGEFWIDHQTMKDILSDESLKNDKKDIKLSEVEKDITSLICHGLRNKEIATKLKLTEQKVKNHCYHIYKKYGVNDRLQLVVTVYIQQPEWDFRKSSQSKVEKDKPKPISFQTDSLI